MSSNRVAILEKYYEEDPRDPFNIYALALELTKHDRHRARELFAILLKEYPGYTPTYYHAGNLWADLGDARGAKAIYEKGIEACRKVNELKAIRELTSALDLLDDETT